MIRLASQEDLIELRIPSRIGQEKVAMLVVAAIAQNLEMPASRIEDLTTVLSEAILNSIEHGNQMNEHLQVLVNVTLAADRLIITVSDQGRGFNPPEGAPNLDEKISGNSPTRGWGWFLIQQLVDQWDVIPTTDGGTCVRLVMMLKRKVTQTDG